MEIPPEVAVTYDTVAGVWPSMSGTVNQHTKTGYSGLKLICSNEKLSELTYKNKRFVFNRDMVVCVMQEEYGWTIECDEYGLMGYGRSRGEAELAFRFDFSLCWNEIVCEEDERLAPEAIEIKRKLLDLVKGVM